MTFQVGDKVIYPNHGLGVVQGIETKTILGTTCGFYHLRMVANETTVLVPVDNVDGVGLRRAIDDEEIERLFSLLGDGKIDNHQNWKGRFKDNSDRMRTGSIYDVVEVLKSLTFLARSKNLSFREKRMLDRAKFLVVSEISEVSHEVTIMVEEKVDRALERCFTMKNRSIARAKAAKATRRRASLRAGRPPRRPDRRDQLSSSSGPEASRRFRPFFAVVARFPFRGLISPCVLSSPPFARSPPTSAVSLYVLLVGSPFVLFALAIGNPAILYRVGRLGVRLGLCLSGITYRVEGGENIQRAPRRGLRREPRQQRRAADPLRRAARALSAAADPLQGRAAQAAGARAAPSTWPASSRSSAAIPSRACRPSIAPPRRCATATRS